KAWSPIRTKAIRIGIRLVFRVNIRGSLTVANEKCINVLIFPSISAYMIKRLAVTDTLGANFVWVLVLGVLKSVSPVTLPQDVQRQVPIQGDPGSMVASQKPRHLQTA